MKLNRFVLKLVLFSILIGALVGVLELFIGHRYILDPLLYDKDPGFVYESYFAPTYYGFNKSVTVAIIFFLAYFFIRKKMPIIKPLIVGIVGTLVFGIFYYLTFPATTSSSSSVIAIVHFSFIAVISYIVTKIGKLR